MIPHAKSLTFTVLAVNVLANAARNGCVHCHAISWWPDSVRLMTPPVALSMPLLLMQYKVVLAA